MRDQIKKENRIVIHCHGSGVRADGRGSFAWIRLDNNESHVERVEGLTNIAAEYRAVLSALNTVLNGSSVLIRSSSEVMCRQLTGHYEVNEPSLARLQKKIESLIGERSLTVWIRWLPSRGNRAKPLLKPKKTRRAPQSNRIVVIDGK